MLKVQFTLMQDVAVQRSQKMQRVIRDNQPLNRVEKEEWEMAAWKTPDIPRGFFNTTNRTVYSAEESVEGEDEDRIHHDKQDEEDDDLVYMGEHAQQDNDDDDDEEQPITVMQPRYMDVIETFGQQIRANDIAPPQNNVAPPGPNVEHKLVREQMIRRHRNSGIPPRPTPTHQKDQPPYPEKTQATRKVQFSALLPPRDPRLHRSIVTPPCPINIGEMQTPMEDKQYTHLSFLDLLLQFTYEICFSLHIIR